MARRTYIGEDRSIIQYGSSVRLDRGGAQGPDQPHSWFIYQLTDVADDPDTTEDERWEEVASYPETEPGECPEAALRRAEALAEKE